MTAASYLKSLYLCWLSPQKCDRALFRRILKAKPLRIVEVGLGDGARARDVIEMAQRASESPVTYCGIDLFEAADVEKVLPLKTAHNTLAKTGAKIRLIPGDVFSALARNANFLTETDLLIFDADVSDGDIERAEPFLPRMIHPGTLVARYEQVKDAAQIRWTDPRAEWRRKSAA